MKILTMLVILIIVLLSTLIERSQPVILIPNDGLVGCVYEKKYPQPACYKGDERDDL